MLNPAQSLIWYVFTLSPLVTVASGMRSRVADADKMNWLVRPCYWLVHHVWIRGAAPPLTNVRVSLLWWSVYLVSLTSIVFRWFWQQFAQYDRYGASLWMSQLEFHLRAVRCNSIRFISQSLHDGNVYFRSPNRSGISNENKCRSDISLVVLHFWKTVKKGMNKFNAWSRYGKKSWEYYPY